MLGDTIGIVAPSSPLYLDGDELTQYWRSAINNLLKLGLNVKVGMFVSDIDPKKRANDINYMFYRDDVAAIFCATGGSKSQEVIEHIDFDIISENPKIIMGQSDVSNLLNTITFKTGMPTFHGQNVLWGMGKHFSQIDNLEILKCLFNGSFDVFDNLAFSNPKSIRSGFCEGVLVGGNFDCFRKFFLNNPDFNFKNKILFLESFMLNQKDTIYALADYYKAGLFNQISGLVIGNNYYMQRTDYSGMQLEEMILHLTGDLNFPIFKVDSFGHCMSNIIIPIGVRGFLNSDDKFWGVSPNSINFS